MKAFSNFASESFITLICETDTIKSRAYFGGSKKLESKELFVVSIGEWNKEEYYVMVMMDDMSVQGLYIPKTFEVMLPEEETKLHKKKFKQAVQNLDQYLMYQSIPSVGSDPEIFVTDKKDALIPAFDFLGSKAKPSKAPLNDRGAGSNNCYWDGFQAEFDTQAGSCLAYHVDSVQTGLRGILAEARKHNKDAKLSIKNTFDIPPSLLKDSKDEHVEFGCMPSLNAYGMEGIKMEGRAVNFRSAGGHIHFGLNNLKKENAPKIVKALDAILGVACVSLFAKYDDPRRRVMYGLAGEYRLPKHGLEYRTLSNAWLAHPLIAHIVFDTARVVAKFGMAGMLHMWDATEEEIIETINTCNVRKARKILKKNKDLFCAILKAKYGTRALNVFEIFLKGMDSVIKDADNIVGNWDLDGKWVTHSGGKNKCWSAAITDVVTNKVKVS